MGTVRVGEGHVARPSQPERVNDQNLKNQQQTQQEPAAPPFPMPTIGLIVASPCSLNGKHLWQISARKGTHDSKGRTHGGRMRKVACTRSTMADGGTAPACPRPTRRCEGSLPSFSHLARTGSIWGLAAFPSSPNELSLG